MHEGAGDRHPLQLAAGQLARQVVAAAVQADRRQHLKRSRRRHAVQQQRHGDVLRERQMRQDVEGLEHEAELLPAQARGGVVGEARDGCAVDQDVAAVGAFESGDQVEERRLADARVAHDRDEFARAEGEIESVENDAAAGVGLVEASAFQSGRNWGLRLGAWGDGRWRLGWGWGGVGGVGVGVGGFTPFDALGLLWNLFCFGLFALPLSGAGLHFLCCCKERKQRKQLLDASPMPVFTRRLARSGPTGGVSLAGFHRCWHVEKARASHRCREWISSHTSVLALRARRRVCKWW